MEYEITLKVHSQLFDLKSSDANFTIFLYRCIEDDFEIKGNNSRLTALRAYVKVCYQLFLQEEVAKKITHKIELLT